MMVYIKGADRDQLRQAVAEKYKNGKSVRQIAFDIDKSYSTAHVLLREAGVKLRPKGYTKLEYIPDALAS